MNKSSLIIHTFLIGVFVTVPVLAEKNTELTIYQVMQRVIDRYPSLKISELEVAQAAEQRQQVESSLGWILNSAAGVTHDLTGIGTPSDRMDISGSIGSQLKSGATLSLSGSYRYEDSSLVFSPLLPNPAHTTRLDLSYRVPLSQGEGNPLYTEGLIAADAGHDLAKANQLLTHIILAEQVKELFYSFALTNARIENARQAVQRALELKDYINKNARLGLSEEKDLLQAQAQLHSKLAERSVIQPQWNQQNNSLNRLMLEEWTQVMQPVLILTENNKHYDISDLIKMTTAYHPTVKISQANLQIAESQIRAAQDEKQDSLDLVMSVGTRTSDGNNATSTISEKDWAGAVSIEYRHLFDDKGTNSKYKQAQLNKSIALQNIQQTNDDIRYTVSGLVEEINAAKLAIKAFRKKLNSESLKLKEAEHRFRSGRVDTAQLIEFQNDYSIAQLRYQNQKIDLNNRIIGLQILSGQFWSELKMQPQPLKGGVKK